MNPDLKKYYPQDYVLKYTIVPLVYKFITPNQLTIIRYICTPFVILFLLMENYSIGVPLFLFAAFTDMLDGSLARVKDKITKWGIINDPIADKLLILSTAIIVCVKYINFYLVIALFLVELITVLLPLIALKNLKNHPIPSNIFGKIKFTFEVISILTLLIGLWANTHSVIFYSSLVLIMAIIFAMISLGLNIYKFRKILNNI